MFKHFFGIISFNKYNQKLAFGNNSDFRCVNAYRYDSSTVPNKITMLKYVTGFIIRAVSIQLYKALLLKILHGHTNQMDLSSVIL